MTINICCYIFYLDILVMHMKRHNILTLFILAIFSSNSYGQVCSSWSEARVVGKLDHTMINEASGIEVSLIDNSILYHINDSGNGPYYYSSKFDGSESKKIRINNLNLKRSDYEDISTGKCYDKKCLFIGDIGDNLKSRDNINIIIIEENNKSSSVTPLKIVRLIYPDHPRNAEAFAVHPNGDLFIITKEESLRRQKSFPSKIYKTSRNKWENAGPKPLTLEHVGTLDIKPINSKTNGFLDNVITSLDISEDGKKFVVLTYQHAYEFNIDLSKAHSSSFDNFNAEKDYRVIELKRLPQQESIAYLQGSKSILYNTEYRAIAPNLMRVDCLD